MRRLVALALLLAPLSVFAQTQDAAPVPVACNPATQASVWNGSAWSCVSIGGGGGGSPLQSKLLSFTRSPTAATANVTYECGFAPKAVVLFGSQGGSPNVGFMGAIDQAGASGGLYDAQGGNFIMSTPGFAIGVSGHNQTATLSAFTSTGFTLTWTRNGSPGGPDYTVKALCLG